MIDIVGKQNITFNLTFRSTLNFWRKYFGCNFCISLRMYVSILTVFLMLVIISNVDEYNSHFSAKVYPFSADDHNQHSRGNVKKTTANDKLP